MEVSCGDLLEDDSQMRAGSSSAHQNQESSSDTAPCFPQLSHSESTGGGRGTPASLPRAAVLCSYKKREGDGERAMWRWE